MQFVEKIRQKSRTANNIVNVCLCPGLYILEDVVNLLLDVDNRVNVAHDWDLEGFFAIMYNNDKHKTMIGV